MMKIDKDVMQWEFSYDLCIENEYGKCRISLQDMQQVKVIQAEIDKVQELVETLEYYEESGILAKEALCKYRDEVDSNG